MLSIGQLVDRYRVEALLGQGGMATVYRVRHVQLEADRALKVMSLLHPTIRRRLLQEGKLQASLSHPNVVAVTDVLEVAGAPALLMEYVPGPSLEHFLRTHRPTLSEALALFRSILAGVAYAHEQGLVHRDLKPANVLLLRRGDEIVPKVADFGLAKVVEDELGGSGNTRTGTGMGTPAYMAPEQIRDAKRVDQRADVFALGCILYELVCGRRAFAGDDLLTLLTAISASDYPQPRSLAPDLPLEVEATILGCLVADRDGRLQDCRAILDSLPPAAPARWTSAALALAAAPVEDRGASVDLAGTGTPPLTDAAVPAAPATEEPSSETWFPGMVVDEGAPGGERPGTLVPGTVLPATAGGPPPAQAVTELPGEQPPAAQPPATDRSTAGGASLGWKLFAGASGVVAVVALAWILVGDRPPAPAAAPSPAPSPAPAEVHEEPSAEVATPAAGTSDEPPPAEDAAEEPAAGPPTKPTLAAGQAAPAAVARPPALPLPAPETGTEPAAPAPATGTLRVTGDAEQVLFKGAAGTFGPGPVPAGTYEIVATFPGRAPAPAGSVTVTTGKEVVLRCTAAFVKCVQ